MSNTSSIEMAIALHGCLGEHVTVHIMPQGSSGLFLGMRGRLEHAARQPAGGVTMSTRRYALGCPRHGYISFDLRSVSHLSDCNTIIYLRA